ncbi:FtsQ-type POTRA domain-containing protein [Chlorobium sp. N1]|uniref:cell division protein FtsQ/DivIB n=1 Tax=Chlorobium sp. N1 TaxID=2491138 RepID=UPI0010392B67|nr:FtsQ-type POTRA domain-containing protein [Chlorobium sp. N1]TCD48176.1 FtsQ-type POTRA domain-containing protein [Chlorobium sp. N1]
MTDSPKESASGAAGAAAPAPGKGGGGTAFLLVFIPVLILLGWLWKSASSWKEGVRVRTIVVEGTDIVAGGDVRSALSRWIGRPMDGVDTAEVAGRVASIPWVKDAVVGREMNGILRITLRERRPMAFTRIDGEELAIDRGGALMPRRMLEGTRFRGLLRVTGVGTVLPVKQGFGRIDAGSEKIVRHFVDALDSTRHAALLVRSFHFDRGGKSYFTVAGDPARFIVGNGGALKEKLEKFEIFWRQVVSKKGFGRYETVDLRFQDRVFTTDPPSGGAPPEASP